MAKRDQKDSGLGKRTFGDLVRVYREQMGLSQSELAERWGYTREYVSLVERGKRKLDQIEQVYHLADILEIPQEQLDAIGRGIPQRKIDARNVRKADDALIQALLIPAQATVKLSWLVWYANHDTVVLDSLADTITRLEQVIEDRRGALLQPAQELLAYAYEMMGKVAFDQLNYPVASGHFQAMFELGEEINNHPVMATALIRQGDVLRRRGRYEAAVNRLELAKRFTGKASAHIQGMREQTAARVYAEYGKEQQFLQAIEKAQTIAQNKTPDLDTISSQFTLTGVMEERAQGHTLLWQPEEAIKIYTETEKLHPVRPLREMGVFTILKAQAYTYAGYMDIGVEYALEGLKLAQQYHSKRHMSRVQRMYDRLRVTPLGSSSQLHELGEILRETQV